MNKEKLKKILRKVQWHIVIGVTKLYRHYKHPEGGVNYTAIVVSGLFLLIGLVI